MRRSFGCPVHDLLYGPLDSATMQEAEYYVRDSIGRFVPEARILSVDLSRPAANTVRLSINFSVPSIGEEASRSLSFTPDQLAQ
jgi:phage baseplate assembly protein W